MMRLPLIIGMVTLLVLSIDIAGSGQTTGNTLTKQPAAPAASLPLAERLRVEKEYLAKAKQNIEKYRKGDAALVFTDAKGKPLRNLSVTINQVSQDFLFGNLCEEVFRPGLKPFLISLS